jgi:ribosomal protein L37AE/L43A
MALFALRCPNCGSNISRQSMKCEYCGAEVVLGQDGHSMLPRNLNACPTCKMQIAEGVWFCPNCGQVTTQDAKTIEHLRQIQKKFVFQQDDIRAKLAQIKDKLESNEFVYYLLYHNGFLSNKYYAVTDKKLIKLDYNQYWQASLSDIVSVSDPIYRNGDGMFVIPNASLKVQTFTETVTLDFGESMDYNFFNALHQAISDYTCQRKNIQAVVCNLKYP